MEKANRVFAAKPRVNFWVDLVIACAFVVVAVSGVVLLAAGPAGGYRGGRNPAAARDLLFLSRTVWRDLHDWSGIAMVAGVAVHLLLHAKWIACMARNVVRKVASRRRSAESCPSAACGET